MERWSSNLVFPITACALGVLAAVAFAAVSAPVWASFAIGLSTAVGALALRNWWIGEEERPLLAEELIGLHEAIDSLRAESQELRDLMSEAVEIAEYRISEDAGAPGVDGATPVVEPENGKAQFATALEEARRSRAEQEAQLARLEERIVAIEASAKVTEARVPNIASPTPYMDRIEARIDASDGRMRKLVKAMSLAIDATRRHEDELRAIAERASKIIPTTPSTETRESELVEPQPSEPDESAPISRSIAPPRAAPPSRSGDPLTSGGAEAAMPPAVLVQPIFRAANKQLRLLEALPEGEAADDIAAGALLERALRLAAGFDRQNTQISALFRIGLSALRSAATLEPLLAQLRARPSMAARLTPTLSHAEVAEISDQDFAVMQRLADTGIRFALDNVDGAALDINRTAEAGVRFILLNAAEVSDREGREPGALARLARNLAQRGVTLVLTDVNEPGLSAFAAAEPAVLAQGDQLAEPRRIRLAAELAGQSD